MSDGACVSSAAYRDVTLEKHDPTWRYARRASSGVRGVLVTLGTESGVFGHGYAPEGTWNHEPPEILRVAAERATELVRGMSVHAVGAAVKTLAEDERAGCSVAVRSAVESALVDLQAQLAGRPLSDLLGGRLRDVVPVARILPLKEPKETAESARRLASEGYRYLKVKIANDGPGRDESRVKAVRDAVGDSVHLSVDANQSYTAKAAIRFSHAIDSERIAIFEQPVPADDLRGLGLVTREVACAVEAHESASTVWRVNELARSGAVDAVNVQLGKFGIRGILAAAAICEANGLGFRLGAHVGPTVYAATAVHVAAVLPSLSFGCEVGEFARLHDPVSRGIAVQDGAVTVPQAAGLGVEMLSE